MTHNDLNHLRHVWEQAVGEASDAFREMSPVGCHVRMKLDVRGEPTRYEVVSNDGRTDPFVLALKGPGGVCQRGAFEVVRLEP